MVNGYAPEYSEAEIGRLTGQYGRLLDPEYERSRAAIATAMGGRGTLYGTPGLNKMQLLEQERMRQVGGYGQQLMQEALGARRGERLTAEERAYETPFRAAPLTGMYGGAPTMAASQFGETLGLQTRAQTEAERAGLAREALSGREMAEKEAMGGLEREWYPRTSQAQIERLAGQTETERLAAGAAQSEAQAKQIQSIIGVITGLPQEAQLPMMSWLLPWIQAYATYLGAPAGGG